MIYVVIANVVIWMGILGYVFFLSKEHRDIVKRIDQIERDLKKGELNAK